MNSLCRGALIVVEGCDRSGKTTQCKKLVEYLVSKNIVAQYINFPARETLTGKLLDAYLSNKTDLDDHVVHLLFSANRWEAQKRMTDLLLRGVTLIVDRYSYSGVAFSVVKGMDRQWCWGAESGLLAPDLVLLLTLSAEAAAKRGGFGTERYEVPAIQLRVMEIFESFAKVDPIWTIVDADNTMENLQDKLRPFVLETIEKYKESPLAVLK